jgi:hypothetical protein
VDDVAKLWRPVGVVGPLGRGCGAGGPTWKMCGVVGPHGCRVHKKNLNVNINMSLNSGRI